MKFAEPTMQLEGDAVPLANNQRLIWNGQQVHSDVPLYEVPYRFFIRGPIDPDRFIRAVGQLIEQTDVLRIVASDLQWRYPLVREALTEPCSLTDVSGERDPNTAADQIVERRLASHFQTTQSLCDATLIRLADDDWQFFLTLHHALTDALSGRIFLKQLARIYTSNETGQSVRQLSSYRQFIDFEDRIKRELAFQDHRKWFDQRSGFAAGTRFYSGRSAVGTTEHTRVVVPLVRDENEAIARIAGASPFRQITPPLSHFNVFATAMIAWLHRLEQRNEICIGATSHGRSTDAFRETIGLFMQLLPFRVSVDSGDSFESLSRKVAIESMGFLGHSQPGVMTADTLRAFDVALNVIDLSVDDFCGMPTRMQWLHNGFGDPERKLTISAHTRSSDEWELLFDFGDSAFSAHDRAKAVNHFRRTLSRLSTSPNAAIASFDLLTEADQNFLSLHCGAERATHRLNLWQRFSDICERNGSKIAVAGSSLELTYDGLRLLANKLAGRLEQTQCGNVVPLICRRDEKAVIAMMGVLASDRCFLLIDADDPVERRSERLRQSGPGVMIDATEDDITLHPIDLPHQSACALTQDACYILFTSGSTGKPNGVVVGHESLWNLLVAFEEIAPLRDDCRCSWWTNVGFDVAIYEVFSALLFGRSLYIPGPQKRLDADEMIDWMDSHQIQSAYLPPFFLEATDRHLATGRSLPLKRLLVGVEPIPQRRLASIASQIPELNLINGYGPTEATICATLHQIDPHSTGKGPASIGKPVAGNRIKIVDPNAVAVPPGVPGELWIGGAGLAQGYLGNEQLTRERFVRDPLEEDAGVWYRSGDRVRLRDDGTLEFLGRIDDQFKLAGVRVEPGEIASLIRQYDGVSDCCVLPELVEGSVKGVVAFVEGTGQVDPVRLRSHLRAHLTPTLMPSRLFLDSRLPRNANGKIDRAVLRDRMAERAADDSSPFRRGRLSPRNAVEFTLLHLIQSVLGVGTLDIHSDFFEIGGSSFDAMTIVAQANALGIDITVQDLFRHRNVSEMASAIEQIDDQDIHSANPPQLSPSRSGTLSTGQQAIWRYTQSRPDSPAYQFQVRWSCNGRLDIGRVAACFTALAERHPALRTTIGSDAGIPFAVVRESLAPSIRTLNRDASVDEIIADGKRPFDLASDSPLRVLLVQFSDGSDTLAITFHHISVDQHSVAQLMDEFSSLYRAACVEAIGGANRVDNGRGMGHRPPDPQQTVLARLKWWESWLDGCDRSIRLPIDFPTPSNGSDAGELCSFALAPSLSESIRAAAADCGVSVSTFLLASYSVLLARYAATEDFTIGLPVSQRGPSTVDEIGYLIEALPFACRAKRTQPFEDYVRCVHHDLSELLANRQISHHDLAEKFGNLFDTLFVIQQPVSSIQLTDKLMITPEVSDLGSAKFDLTWFVADSEPQITCAAEFRTGRFQRETIELMVDHWQTLLSRLVGDTCQPIGKIDFRTRTDRAAEKRLAGRQESFPNACQWRCVSEMIDAQASKSPEAVALHFARKSISYREFVETSERLAAQLRHAGVGENTPVGLVMPRSLEQLVAILAILKSGGAYVPFDPDVSIDRLRRTAHEAGVACAVGTGRDVHAVFENVIEPISNEHFRGEPSSPLSRIVPNSLAYVVHTSGSTGQPKGVEVTRSGLLGSTMARNAFYGPPPGRFLMVSPAWFDSSIAGIFWTLCNGGTLVLPTEDELRDAEALADLIERHGVTDTLMLPSVYQLLLSYASPAKLRTLQRVVVAGESCQKSVVERHCRQLPGTKLFNEYGPTEATVWATACQLSSDDAFVSIGRSVPGTPVCLVDRDMSPVLVGGIGEICIGGSRLALGYRNDAELTELRFIDDPRPNFTGRLYRTGDLARMRRDGSLLYLGRLDDQIKVNGGRVEPAEIEAALIEIDGIADAAVALVERSALAVSENTEDLINALSHFTATEAEAILDRAESARQVEFETFVMEDDEARISFEIKRRDFLRMPRERQRKWLIDQALRESAANLHSLDQIADRMVPGNEQPHFPRDLSTEQLTPQEIMEDWQTPLMQAMAYWVTESHGDVLEIGFGRGVAATMIQDLGVRSHTVIEMNPHSIADFFEPWRTRFRDRNVRLIHGRWQDILDQLATYDGIFFHAFPMNEAEFVEYVASSATFAEHFFPVAHDLLRPGGVFTYLTTEIDSLSRRHQRSLFEYFDEIQLKVQSLSVPHDTKDAWWADSMVVVRAIK